jgi:3D (Asp-Asp-Asp) domain-containing protein
MGKRRGKGGDNLQRREFRLARTALSIVIGFAIFAAVAANRDDVVQAQRLATVNVLIRSNGAERHIRTAQTTVGATLKEAGVEVGPIDKVTPATNQRPKDGMIITVVKVKNVVEVEKQPSAFDSVKTFTTSLRPGQVKLDTPGEPGEKLIRYVVRYEDGKPVQRTLIGSEVAKKPANKVVSIGSRGRYTSRGEYRTRKILKMSATAYEPGPRSCGKYATGRTASGLQAGYGVVAVDPRVIPLGTKLYVEGYGYAIAGDRGRAIKGNRIDLGFATVREALNFGTKSVIVHVLE